MKERRQQVQIVEKTLKYGRRRYGIGELVMMPAKHARLFIAVGRACNAPRGKAVSTAVGICRLPRDSPASPSLPVTIVETVEAEPEIEQSGGDYETEDMQAEEISPRTGRPKRQYRRRDMRAD
jgi:hypothetical protein